MTSQEDAKEPVEPTNIGGADWKGYTHQKVLVYIRALQALLDQRESELTQLRAENRAKDAEIANLTKALNRAEDKLAEANEELRAIDSLAQAERKRADDAFEEAAKVCEKPKPECCGSFEQDEFSIDPVCCGKYEPGEFMDGIECATAIRALKGAT